MENISPTDAIRFRRQLLLALALFAISAGHLLVDRRNMQLTKIPGGINPNVTILKLGSNYISRVEEGDLGRLVWLQELHMSHNKIVFISDSAFVNNTKLAKIVMSYYILTEFPLAFATLWSSIADLNLLFGTLTKRTVQLTNYPMLHFFQMGSSNIELETGHLPSLKRLFAKNCGLDKFPNLTGAPILERAHLHNNNFTEIPRSATIGLRNLTRFTIPGCRVSYLPDLSHLVSLEILKVENNYLIAFPDLYHLPFATVTMSGNPLLCDKTVCWIRMWDSVKPAIQMDEMTCAYPQQYSGSKLKEIHPADLHCYEGYIRPCILLILSTFKITYCAVSF